MADAILASEQNFDTQLFTYGITDSPIFVAGKSGVFLLIIGQQEGQGEDFQQRGVHAESSASDAADLESAVDYLLKNILISAQGGGVVNDKLKSAATFFLNFGNKIFLSHGRSLPGQRG